jgi:ATP-binding cassette, subfamily B, bacterial
MRGAGRSLRSEPMQIRRLRQGTARRILAFGKPYTVLLVGLMILLALDAGLGTVIPLVFRHIINEGVTPRRADVVVTFAAIAAGIAVVQTALGLVERFCSSRIGEGLIFDLRTVVFAHVQRMPIAFFTRTQTGALVTRLNSDVMGAQQAFTSTLSGVVVNSLTAVTTVIAMLALSWPITLAALVMLPIFVVPARLIGRKLAGITREAYTLNGEMGQLMTERFGVAGALLVKLFGRPVDEDEMFASRAGRVRDIGVTQAMYSRVFYAALSLVAALATALVYGWGGVEAVRGVLDVGTLIALTAYLSRLYGPITQLSNVHVDVMTALVSFERVFEVLDVEPLVADREGARTLEGTHPRTVEFRDVRFAYPRADQVSLASLESVAVLDHADNPEVLHGVTFTARAGELVALVGPSGAGKSTITQLLTRLYDVTGGAVLVDGVDVRDLTQASLRAQVGVVTQDPHMFHDTVLSNLRYARPDATEAEVWDALDAAQVGTLVRGLPDGLATVVGERGYRLSGGEKQRLAIARMLLKQPGVIVLDEATAHLDSENEAAVQRALANALAGRTSLVIAHRLSTVRDADQILVIDDGVVVQRGSHAELLAEGGLYSDLYTTQFASQDDRVEAFQLEAD